VRGSVVAPVLVLVRVREWAWVRGPVPGPVRGRAGRAGRAVRSTSIEPCVRFAPPCGNPTCRSTGPAWSSLAVVRRAAVTEERCRCTSLPHPGGSVTVTVVPRAIGRGGRTADRGSRLVRTMAPTARPSADRCSRSPSLPTPLEMLPPLRPRLPRPGRPLPSGPTAPPCSRGRVIRRPTEDGCRARPPADPRPPSLDPRPPLPDLPPPSPDLLPPSLDPRPPLPDLLPPSPDLLPPSPDRHPPSPRPRPHSPDRPPVGCSAAHCPAGPRA
jgi:hypothetical protein